MKRKGGITRKHFFRAGNNIYPVSLTSRQLQMVEKGKLEENVEAFQMGDLNILCGSSELGRHISIYCPKRWPTMLELSMIRYKLAPHVAHMVLEPPDIRRFDSVGTVIHLWESTGHVFAPTADADDAAVEVEEVADVQPEPSN